VTAKRKAIVVVAGGILLGGLVAGASRRSGLGVTARPKSANVAVTRQSDRNPAEVERHWTPERIRQAQENMRRLGR